MQLRFLLPVLGLVSLTGCPGAPAAKNNPTFHKDIAPILNNNCVNCHSPGQIGPFSLLTYADALAFGAEIQIQTEERLMPPWHIVDDGSCQSYKDSRLLTNEQIDTIRVWFDNGMPEGNPADAPPPPPPPPALDRVDANLDMNVDYLPDENLSDDYRCFLVDPGLLEDQFMTAYEVLPGSPQVVHHIILFTLNDDAAQAQAEALDGADGKPGFTCFGDAGVPSAPIVAWAPGINLQEMPSGTGVRLPAGRKLAMQIHYNTQSLKPGQKLPTDRTVINLKLEPQISLEAILALPGDFNFVLPPGLEEASTEETSSLDFLPIPVRIQGVLPHMHTRGQTLKFEVTREDGSTECLTQVDDWDFAWQQTYFYEEPVRIFPQDSIRIRCTYNTLDETAPITFGEGTGDEMCLVGVYLTL